MASAGTPYRLVPAHFYPCQTALGNCYGLKLAECRSQFRKKINLLCYFVVISGTPSFPAGLQQSMASTSTTRKKTKATAAASAEQRTLRLKEQLLSEELAISDDLVNVIVDDVGVPLDQTAVDGILQVN